MLRNILIAAAALSAIAVGSASTASANGYYSHQYYKPHLNYYKPHYVQKRYVQKHYNYDYNDNYDNSGYYVQNDCGWQTVKVIRWNHGYRYVDFIKTWTCY